MSELKKEKINSLLMIIYFFIASLTLPFKVVTSSGASVWIITGVIIATSLLVNQFAVSKRIFYFLLCICILILFNYLLVSYKNIVLFNIVEFLKFGVIPIFLISYVKDYTVLLRYWYYIGLISFIIWIYYLDLVVAGDDIGYMSFGIQLSYSFIIFCIYLYNKEGLYYKLFNLMLTLSAFGLIFVYGNRSSALACLVVLVFCELRKMKKKHLFKGILKLSAISVVAILLFTNSYKILLFIKSLIATTGYSTYSIEKLLVMLEQGLVESSSGRNQMYIEAFDLLNETNLFPKGIGYYEYITGITYPHNVVIDGLLIFGVFFIPIVIVAAFFMLKFIYDSDNQNMNLFLISIGLFMIVRLFFSNSFLFETTFWIVLGILISNYNVVQSNQGSAESRFKKIAITRINFNSKVSNENYKEYV